jgi:hypothetical protein
VLRAPIAWEARCRPAKWRSWPDRPARRGFDQPPHEPLAEFLPLKPQRRPQECFGKSLALTIIEPVPALHRGLEQITRHFATFQNENSGSETQKSRIANMLIGFTRSHVFRRESRVFASIAAANSAALPLAPAGGGCLVLGLRQSVMLRLSAPWCWRDRVDRRDRWCAMVTRRLQIILVKLAI